MSESTNPKNEASRLEELWSSTFGDTYTERNRKAGKERLNFWRNTITKFEIQSVLEIGCNLGANLQWLTKILPTPNVCGIDINPVALTNLRERFPLIHAVRGPARSLPFAENQFDLTFTAGVLIHQPECSLTQVMSEIVRCSRRYVLCLEYFSENIIEVPYRNQSGALFKRNYGQIYQDIFPSLRLLESEFLGKEKGWDDVTYWLFEVA